MLRRKGQPLGRKGPTPRSPEEGPNLEKEGEKEVPRQPPTRKNQTPERRACPCGGKANLRKGRAKPEREGTTPLTFSDVKKHRT